MQVVVERLALTQELRAEDDALVSQALAERSRVAHRDGRLDHDPSCGVHLAHGGDSRLDGGSIEEVLVAVVVRRRGDDCVVRARIGLGSVKRHLKAQLALPRLSLGQEPLDLVVLDGRDEVVQLLDLLRHDIQCAYLVVLRQQNS